MSWIRSPVMPTVVKLKSSAPVLTVQRSPCAKSVVGSSVNSVGPPLCVNSWAPLVAQVMVNVGSAGPLNVTVMLLSTGTSLAPSAGSVPVTTTGGGPPAPFCGSGAPAVKSAELLSVSVPAALRASAVVLLRPGAAAVSKSLAVP